ncbi:hypothetical protein LINGRAPRIM_LOCUS975 [Linum grandiflorum]
MVIGYVDKLHQFLTCFLRMIRFSSSKHLLRKLVR